MNGSTSMHIWAALFELGSLKKRHEVGMCVIGAMEGEIRGRYDHISLHTCMELSKLKKTIGFFSISQHNSQGQQQQEYENRHLSGGGQDRKIATLYRILWRKGYVGVDQSWQHPFSSFISSSFSQFTLPHFLT